MGQFTRVSLSLFRIHKSDALSVGFVTFGVVTPTESKVQNRLVSKNAPGSRYPGSEDRPEFLGTGRL
jgi:hypothetical protein